VGELELSRGGQAVKTDSPDGTMKPPASGQDWVRVFYLLSLELPRHEVNKSISGLSGLFLPAEQGFGLGLPDAIEDLLSWEGRKIVGSNDEKTPTGSTCRHTRPAAAVALLPDTRQPDGAEAQ
jgi:hypothetical protein